LNDASVIEGDLHALTWLLLSPPLLAHAQAASFTAQETAAIQAWLAQVRARPAAFLAHMAAARAAVGGAQPGVMRLGRYAERMLEFFLLHGPTHRLIAANLPLRRSALDRAVLDHTTTGEIDFLVQPLLPSPVHTPAEHWELAVKYFLCHASGSVAQASDFVGPDERETFDRKLQKLMGRQLANLPPAPWSKAAYAPKAFAKGWMFYPLHAPKPSCADLHPAHCHGTWMDWAQAQQFDAPQEHRFVHLDRQAWLAPAHHVQAAQTCTWAQLLVQLQAHWQREASHPQFPKTVPGAQLVAQLRPTQSAWAEVTRYFVKPPAPPIAT
jgi:uncharacterized protein